MKRIAIGILIGCAVGYGIVKADGPGLVTHREWAWDSWTRVFAICDEGNGTLIYLGRTYDGAAMQIQPNGCERKVR